MEILETYIVTELSEEIRLQEYAAKIFKTITSRSAVKKAIKKQRILIDGTIGETGSWIKEGQKIELIAIEKKTPSFHLELSIIFEDEHIAIINKPAGYPTSGNYFKTIENALSFNLKPSSLFDKLPTPQPTHRLDNPTSGILICAKTNKALVALNKQFQDKKIQKTYSALVENRVEGTHILTDDIDGKSAKTTVISSKNFSYKSSNLTLVKALPLTGRTHQIRKHLANQNWPILGDNLYGNTKSLIPSKGLYLTATAITFTHPETQEILSFEVALPKKFRRIIENQLES
ncbi:RluA family pseudouridine synthase [Zunongwangia sp.]|uniref:RluA family pseudouridine synthase n=1 Tax=Zunongwangia sp. TaxID=1965325 RepID=UPI003AA8E96F